MVLKIYRAADAFLYLPTYVAEHYGIFETLLGDLKGDLRITEVQFPPAANGDLNAISAMINESNKSNDSISIAIAEPTAFLSNWVKDNGIRETRVIGAIINKMAFWAVDHTDRVFNSIEEFSQEFGKVIHYNQNLATGFYLGNNIKRIAKIHKFESVNFGDELELLINHNRNNDIKAVAITADIVNLVKETTKATDRLFINYRFSSHYNNYITTGVVTANKYCTEKYEPILNKILEAIQKSIIILYSSNKIAQKICKGISEKINVPLDENEINQIIKLINEEKFYPADLNISKESWNEAVRAMARAAVWPHEEEEEIINTSYDKFVINKYVHNSEKSLAKQLGINLRTFEEDVKDEIRHNTDPLISQIQNLNCEIAMLNDGLKERDELIFGIPKWSIPLIKSLSKISAKFYRHFNKYKFRYLIVWLILIFIYIGFKMISTKELTFTKKEIVTFIASGIMGYFINIISQSSSRNSRNNGKNN